MKSLFIRPFSVRYKNKIEEMFGKDIKISFIKPSNYAKRYQEAINIIYNYNPECILDISDEYSVISYAYSKDFPTFYIPMRNNTSSSFFNYILVDKDSCEKLNEKFNIINENQVCNWIFPEYVPQDNQIFKREDYNLSLDDFIIITIGNNNSVIDEYLAREMSKLLNNNNKFKWLLVGSDAPEFMHLKYKDLFDKKKIIEWGFERNLAGLCKICDIVLRPNTTGSSGATAIAAQQGLPIVMTNFICDSNRWLGMDYSKLENYEELMNEIIKLYEDKEYYIKMKNKVLYKINEVTDANKKWKELHNIMEDKIMEEK